MPPCWITDVLIHSFTPVQKRESATQMDDHDDLTVNLCHTGWQVCVIWDSRFLKKIPHVHFLSHQGQAEYIWFWTSSQSSINIQLTPSNIQSKIILATSFFMVWHFYSNLWWLFAFQMHKWSSLLPSGWMLSEEFEGTSWFFYCKG